MKTVKTRIRIIYRSSFLFAIIIAGFLFTVFFQQGNMPRQSLGAKLTQWWHKRILKTLDIKLSIHGTPTNSATLFVANHLSWLDIHLIGSHIPVHFLSKAEVKDWPVFGWLASKAGTLYIPRGRKHASAQANIIMQQTLLDDRHVVLFPEATTSNGNIKRFHSRLMQSAIDAQCLLQPIAILYPDSNGNTVHEAVLYVDDTTFIQSAKNIIATKNLNAELYFLEPIETQNKNRDELARYAEEQVKSLFKETKYQLTDRA
ncbi:MAG: 1-acyl-sn-glycerol-3-phosphate acyltransferase [Gammaproteobacteria bacterium]|nr:1-acyl-sn-glycerol-3-phosphate acyltransferase [Gammaproteobacteria bacterium]